MSELGLLLPVVVQYPETLLSQGHENPNTLSQGHEDPCTFSKTLCPQNNFVITILFVYLLSIALLIVVDEGVLAVYTDP